jgi:transposase-like protein
MASVDSRLIDTSQMAREGSAIFIRSQQVRDRQHRYLHNRAAHSHQPTRQQKGACKASSPPDMPNGFSR